MAEQIYEISVVQAKAVAALRAREAHMSTGMVATAISMPFWAVDRALEDAYLAKQVTFSAGIGWLAMPEDTKPARAGDEAQTDLVG